MNRRELFRIGFAAALLPIVPLLPKASAIKPLPRFGGTMIVGYTNFPNRTVLEITDPIVAQAVKAMEVTTLRWESSTEDK